ncbi:MAG TPA: hypothetical protein VGO67_23075 [Verrucomicrobiae bacterium]|jgi:hypothetical protein
MTTIDTSICCWAILAPFPVANLQLLAEREWKQEFPYAIDDPPWETIPGASHYNALVSSSPGTEGSDRYFAEILSRQAGEETVYSLWFDIDREQIFEWRNGAQVNSREANPAPVAESLGFTVTEQSVEEPVEASAAVVEGASVDDVRVALKEFIDEGWVHVAPSPTGVLVTASEGPLGTQAWDLAKSFPDSTIYFVQRWPDAFSVILLRGPDELGRLSIPSPDDDTKSLSDIKGAQTPAAIVEILGIPPRSLGLT